MSPKGRDNIIIHVSIPPEVMVNMINPRSISPKGSINMINSGYYLYIRYSWVNIINSLIYGIYIT